MNGKWKIQREALLLFSKYGLRHLSMDDIAHRLSISKKTIYKHFRSKEDLVITVMDQLKDYVDRMTRQILQSNKNPIVKLLEIYAHRFHLLIQFNPAFILELQKYYPKPTSLYESMIENLQYQVMEPLLDEAKEKGYLDENVDVALACTIHKILFDTLVNHHDTLVGEHTAEKVFTHFFLRNIAGLLKTEYLPMLYEINYAFSGSVNVFVNTASLSSTKD